MRYPEDRIAFVCFWAMVCCLALAVCLALLWCSAALLVEIINLIK